MVSRSEIRFDATLDISDVRRGLNQIGRLASGAGGVGGGIGRTVAAGAGIGAGLAVFEQLFERIFELFEDTPVLESFTMALDAVLMAAAPLVGVLLESLTPVIVALTPAIVALTPAITPLIELLGTNLLIAVTILTPGIELLARGLATVTNVITDVVLKGFQFVIDQANRLPFVDIQIELERTTFDFMALEREVTRTGLAAAGASNAAAPRLEAYTNTLLDFAEPARVAAERVRVHAHDLDLFNEASTLAEDALRGQTMATVEWTNAARGLITELDIVQDEMDETFRASDALGRAMALAKQPVEDVATVIEEEFTPAVVETGAAIVETVKMIAREVESVAGLAGATGLGFGRGTTMGDLLGLLTRDIGLLNRQAGGVRAAGFDRILAALGLGIGDLGAYGLTRQLTRTTNLQGIQVYVGGELIDPLVTTSNQRTGSEGG